MVSCSLGVLAYNEENNIRQILQSLLQQRLSNVEIAEIIVVASGCTDRTVVLAQEIAQTSALISVDVQAERAGKAAAVNRLITIAQGDIIVLVGADTLLEPHAIEHLVQPFADTSVGMTGARVSPLNDSSTFLGFTVQMLWYVHHRMALRWPKLGELVAFRNVIAAIPAESATDEVSLEALITAQGLRLMYVPDAVVYNRGPETLYDFFLQRRRIFAGHLAIAANERYVAASMPLSHIGQLLADLFLRDRHPLLWTMGAVLLECWARVLGTVDFLIGYRHAIWSPVRSTKNVQPAALPTTLVMIQYHPKSVRPKQLRHKLRHLPPSHGALLWCDPHRSELLFRLTADHGNSVSLHNRVDALAECVSAYLAASDAARLSYRVVEFGVPTELPCSILPRTTAYESRPEHAALSIGQR